MVAEASQTMKLSPSHTPSILHDVVQTLEFQVKQAEDQHVAEIMALMRQTQRKNDQLEQELARERESIALERQQLAARQNNLREQSIKRQKYIEDSLHARYSFLIAAVSTGILVACVFLQALMFDYLKFPLYWSLLTPIFLCGLIAFGLARVGTRPVQRKAGQAQQKKKPA